MCSGSDNQLKLYLWPAQVTKGWDGIEEVPVPSSIQQSKKKKFLIKLGKKLKLFIDYDKLSCAQPKLC